MIAPRRAVSRLGTERYRNGTLVEAFDRAAIDGLKKGVIVVNTAREGLVDAAAMTAALESGRVRAYTLDAFDKEPPDDWGIPGNLRVIATPHIGGFTDESIDRATEVAVDNLLAALKEAGA